MTTTKQKVAVVTGGSYGIGRDFVVELAKRGYRVMTCARDANKLADLAGQIPGVETMVCDMSDLASVGRFADHVLARAAHIDLIVSNAGRADEIDWAKDNLSAIDVAGEINLNLSGPLKLIFTLLPALRRCPGSGVVVVTSGYGLAPHPRMPVYSAAKAGLRSFIKSLRREMKRSGVHVLEVAPPLVDTPAVQHKTGKKISSIEVVRGALRGFDAGQDEVFPGQVRWLPMLLRLAPSFTESLIAKR